MFELGALNWWAILLATVASFALGWLWYGPLFGRAWLAALGKSVEELQPSPTPFIVSFATALVTCVVLAAIMQGLGVANVVGGLALGLVTGIGFIATSMASDSAFCGWGAKLWGIQAGYRVVYSVIMGGIIGAWP